MTAKGILLNNPFDIEEQGIPWFGLVKPSSDATFCQFQTPIMGIRAGFVDLKTAISKGHNTIRLIVTRFAPPNENDTIKYIANVAAWSGIDKDEVLQLSNIKAVGLAMMHQEVGQFPYDEPTINRALYLAGCTNVFYPDPTSASS